MITDEDFYDPDSGERKERRKKSEYNESDESVDRLFDSFLSLDSLWNSPWF